jgi:hypothetical protein
MTKIIKGHQGDVQFKSVDKIPSTATKIEKKPIALGEHSGHQHVITGDYELFEDKEGNIFAAIGNDGATLQHIHESKFKGFDKKEIVEIADHKPIVEALKPNTSYKFCIHKKFNPFAKVWEKVGD